MNATLDRTGTRDLNEPGWVNENQPMGGQAGPDLIRESLLKKLAALLAGAHGSKVPLTNTSANISD